MISLVVPTRNRAYSLKVVLDTFFTQKAVTEIIFIDDGSIDETKEIIEDFAAKYPEMTTQYYRNKKRLGASASRQKGWQLATNEYVMFCDDDEFIGPSYASTCLQKLKDSDAAIVSGRHLYRLPGEKPAEAFERFNPGLNSGNIFDHWRFTINTDAQMTSTVDVPFTHALFVTTKQTLREYGFDEFYAKGNGYREESDFQIRVFNSGKNIVIIPDVYCVHMHLSEVKQGGQRTGRLARFYWNLYYTHYFLNKNYNGLAKRLGYVRPFWFVFSSFVILEFYRFFLRPFILLPGKIWSVKK